MEGETMPEGSTKLKPYSELTGKEIDFWGGGIWKDRKINTYTDTDLTNYLFSNPAKKIISSQGISIADFGGADGFVCDIVAKSLSNVCISYNIDKNKSALQKFCRDQEEGRKSSSIIAVNEDLMMLPKLPIEKDSINYGILRFVIPYNPKEEQPELLEKVRQTLAPNARLVILHDGAYDKKYGDMLNTFFNEVNNIFRPNCNNYYTSIEEIKSLSEKLGYHTIKASGLPELSAWLSPQAYASRFELSKDQFYEIENIFKSFFRKKVLDISSENGIYRIKRPFVYAILEKR